jgi:hypothetical protein
MVIKQVNRPQQSEVYPLADFYDQISEMIGIQTLRDFITRLEDAGFPVSDSRVIVSEKDKWGEDAFRIQLVLGDRSLIIHCSHTKNEGDLIGFDYAFTNSFENDPDDFSIYSEEIDGTPIEESLNINRRNIMAIGKEMAYFIGEILFTRRNTSVLIMANTPGKGAMYLRIFKDLIKEINSLPDQSMANRFFYSFYGVELTDRGQKILGLEVESDKTQEELDNLTEVLDRELIEES